MPATASLRAVSYSKLDEKREQKQGLMSHVRPLPIGIRCELSSAREHRFSFVHHLCEPADASSNDRERLRITNLDRRHGSPPSIPYAPPTQCGAFGTCRRSSSDSPFWQ